MSSSNPTSNPTQHHVAPPASTSPQSTHPTQLVNPSQAKAPEAMPWLPWDIDQPREDAPPAASQVNPREEPQPKPSVYMKDEDSRRYEPQDNWRVE